MTMLLIIYKDGTVMYISHNTSTFNWSTCFDEFVIFHHKFEHHKYIVYFCQVHAYIIYILFSTQFLLIPVIWFLKMYTKYYRIEI